MLRKKIISMIIIIFAISFKLFDNAFKSGLKQILYNTFNKLEKNGKKLYTLNMKFLVINGPNLDMLSKRDKKHYGDFTLKELQKFIKDFCKENGVGVKFFQSNFEGKIIEKLHKAECDCVILNAGAFTHYSYAIRDAIECIKPKVIEVHISDISAREDFRKVSVIKDVCIYSVMGQGKLSYTKAIEYFIGKAKNGNN